MNNKPKDTKPKKTVAAKSADTRKVFDVKKPGKAPASATSRPIIVGHKPMVQDPSIRVGGSGEPKSVDPVLASGDVEPRPLLSSAKKITITPSAPELPADGDEVSVPVTSKPATAPEPKAVVVPPPAETPTAPEVTDTDTESLPEQVSDGPKPLVPTSKPAEAAPEPEIEEEPEPEEPLPVGTPVLDKQKEEPTPVVSDPQPQLTSKQPELPSHKPDLIEDTGPPLLDMQKAVVSHHHHAVRFGEVVLVILLAILVAAVAFNFLLDADVVKTDLDIPHTDFLNI